MVSSSSGSARPFWGLSPWCSSWPPPARPLPPSRLRRSSSGSARTRPRHQARSTRPRSSRTRSPSARRSSPPSRSAATSAAAPARSGSRPPPPAVAVSYPRNPIAGTSLDKEWITCDNARSSPLRGRCYLAYTDIAHDPDPEHLGSHIAVQSSADGGRTWSPPVLLPVSANIVSPGVQPVVRPNGELVVVYFEDGIVHAVRSSDAGASFSAPERVSGLTFHHRPVEPKRLRAFSLPSAAVDAAGTVYAAWFDCRFRSGCATDDIVWSQSTAPGAWTAPQRIPLGPLRSATDFVLPDLAVDPSSRGAKARLALTYHALSSADCTEASCLLDVYLVTSKSAGARWSRPRRLNPQRMRLGWLAQTASGRMVGDYVATVFAGKRVVSVHAQARAPRAGRFNEAIYAYSLTLP